MTQSTKEAPKQSHIESNSEQQMMLRGVRLRTCEEVKPSSSTHHLPTCQNTKQKERTPSTRNTTLSPNYSTAEAASTPTKHDELAIKKKERFDFAEVRTRDLSRSLECEANVITNYTTKPFHWFDEKIEYSKHDILNVLDAIRSLQL